MTGAHRIRAEADRMRHADFPRRRARSRTFTLGRPRSLRVAPDGSRVVFLRSAGPEDPTHGLWVYDLASGREQELADGRDDGEIPLSERRRRERARESSSGIVAYATDREVRRAIFALNGRVHVADLDTGEVREQAIVGPAYDPRLDPTGRRFAYVNDGDLYVHELDGSGGRLIGEDDPDVSWGVAEFVAAEEMERLRGYWWAPDGDRIVAARVDEFPVDDWHLADPADPASEPRRIAYPAAGRANARVSLAIFDVAGDGSRTDVVWDRETYPYLGRVRWDADAPLTLAVVTRRQDRIAYLTVDLARGTTTTVHESAHAGWVELIASPRWLEAQRLVLVEDVTSDEDPDGTRRVVIGGAPVTPPGLSVQRLLDVDEQRVWFVASRDPQQAHVHRLDLSDGRIEQVTQEPGRHTAAIGGDTQVILSDTMDTERWTERGPGAAVHRGGAVVGAVASAAASPGLSLDVQFLELGPSRAPSALLLPRQVEPPWPVLLSPYGGPHAPPRSHRSALGLSDKQWFADQGYAVLVTDGRGTPGRSAAWERAIRLDLATPVLDDQVAALLDAADRDDRLDLSRVAIRGWSFGGFLAALAALRRPDVFHAAIVGAPVTDWHLYDTYYTERYLGLPDEHPEAYRVSSLVDADGMLIDAAELPEGRSSPGMLLIHGLADDNVVAAHTLRLSRALLAAGRPHEVLPLSGVTHMTPSEVVAENLMRHELDFLTRHLARR